MYQEPTASTPRASRNCVSAHECTAVIFLMAAIGFATPASAGATSKELSPRPPSAESTLARDDASLTSWTLASKNSADGAETPPDPNSAAAPPTPPASSESGPEGRVSTTRGTIPQSDLAMKMTNPVTDLWLIENEFNNFKLEKDPFSPVSGKWVHNWYLQPVLPVNLTQDLSLITRPVIPVFQSVPYVKGISPTGEIKTDRKTAFGDIVLAQVVSPRLPQPWIFAAGPTWIFPTAGSRLTGQGKWQVGPAVGGGVVTPKFMIAALVQQWWSFAGKEDRKKTSQMAILPKVYAFWGDGWSIGYTGQIQVDWKAPHGDRWTVPTGLAIGKVVKFGILPVQIRVGGDYIPIRPEFGPKWNFQLQITPLLPRLIQKPIFG